VLNAFQLPVHVVAIAVQAVLAAQELAEVSRKRIEDLIGQNVEIKFRISWSSRLVRMDR
jgi:hypothetical protein